MIVKAAAARFRIAGCWRRGQELYFMARLLRGTIRQQGLVLDDESLEKMVSISTARCMSPSDRQTTRCDRWPRMAKEFQSSESEDVRNCFDM